MNPHVVAVFAAILSWTREYCHRRRLVEFSRDFESNVTNLMFMHQIAGLYQATAYFWAALFSPRDVENPFQLIVQVVCWPKGCESFRGSPERISDLVVVSLFAGEFQIKDEFICKHRVSPSYRWRKENPTALTRTRMMSLRSPNSLMKH